MSRATGETHYIVEPEGRGDDARFRVLRINPIGQGWGVASYLDADTAHDVASFLNEAVDAEAP